MKPLHLIYAVLATVIIFAAGVVTGGKLIGKASVEPRPPPPTQGFQLARLDQLQRLINQMNLAPEQRLRINRLIRDRQEYIADLMRIIEPDLPGVFVKLRGNINQELLPDQRLELDEMWLRVEQKKFQPRNAELIGRPGEGSMNRPNQQFPSRSNGPRGGQFSRPPQERPRPGEPPRQEPQR